MKDSTASHCLLCGIEYIPKGTRQKFCNPDHQLEHMRLRNIERRKVIEEDLKSQMWKKTAVERYKKFFDLFGASNCSICGMSYKENLALHGVPLHPRLMEPIQDYRILDPKMWQHFCLKCYVEINLLKENII